MRYLFLFLVTFLALACAWPANAAAAGQDLVLFYSNDVQGETAPCGCQMNQLGGLPKKAFQFRAIAQKGKARPHLTLDAGDLLFKHDHIAPGQEEQEEMAAAAIVKAYNLIGYDAVAIGSRDLIAGLPSLRSLQDKAKFAFLSANLVAKSNGQPLFRPSLTLTLGSVKTHILALTGPATLPEAAGATVMPWERVLPALLQQIPGKDDLIVLLSNLPAEDNRRIAETYDRIQLIIQSGATASAISPGPVNNALLVSTAPQGSGIGILEINWQPGGRWGDKKVDLLTKRRADLDRLLWQLGKYRRTADPETALRDQPEQLKAYHALLAQEKALQGEIGQLEQQAGQPNRKGGEPSSYANRFMAMEDTLPDAPDVLAVTDGLDRDLNQLGRRKAKGPGPADPLYVGAQACQPCHGEQFTAWQQTKHAKAYLTLVDKHQQFNTTCLPCHVTGVSMDRADDALSLPENRRGVGCETCHGPGRRHAEEPQKSPLTRQPAAAICQGCHQPPHDTTFDYDRNRKLVH